VSEGLPAVVPPPVRVGRAAKIGVRSHPVFGKLQ
jgi:hypothetical protein